MIGSGRNRCAFLTIVLVVVVLAASACSSPNPAVVPVTALAARPVVAAGLRLTKVLVVTEENHTAASALHHMPYLAALSREYGQTSNYRAVSHPSLPNYLAIAAGSTFDVSDDSAPARHHLHGPSVFDSALTAGATAKIYADAMASPCALDPSGRYAVKHNAWAYFSDPPSRSNCQRFDVPAGSPSAGPLRSDINAGMLPTVGELIPDLCHDGHDCALGTADDWLRQWLPVVMNGPDYRSGQLAIVVTFDEDDISGPNTVLTTVIAPTIAQVNTAAPLTHYSLSRYLSELSGSTPLGDAAPAPSLRPAFGI